MALRQKLRLGDLLVVQKVISQDQLAQALKAQKQGGGRKLGEVLVDEGFCTETAIRDALSDQLHLPKVDLSTYKVDENALKLVPSNIARKHVAIPFAFSKDNPNVLYLAMGDPMDMDALDDFGIVTNHRIEPYVATPTEIHLAIDKAYGNADAKLVAEQYEKERAEMYGTIETVREEQQEVSSSPVVTLVRSMIEQAVRQRASDIHIEPMVDKLRIRYRIDGALFERMTYSLTLLPAIVARVKVISGMDISEKRKPQDGRLTQVVGRQEFDIRVSAIPTVYGEKIVMRLNSKNALTREKSQLGFNSQEARVFDHILKNPHGIILVTGPTGSGKTTTLYTALSELNKEDVNIITVEDPVEANIDGINQIQVNTRSDLTFANALRSILRQDPDIIMIGEIRDSETAEIAVQASITGHLVVSTLHTNSTSSSIGRLVDMGCEPYLLADSIVGIIAQRLVRRLCPICKRAKDPTPDEREILGIPEGRKAMVFEPCGCPQCDHTGYKGRIGVYEIMQISSRLRHAISHHQTAEEIKQIALSEGMRTLRMSATRYVFEGVTSVAEMTKVSFDQ